MMRAGAPGPHHRAMDGDIGTPATSPSSCHGCGGSVTATHMLTKTYSIDEHGRWTRAIDEFEEDIVLACARCGAAQEGGVTSDGETFSFVPRQRI
jgi:hypothetical protein